MKLRRTFAQATLVFAVAVLATGCGGGNDADAGGATPFNIVPSSMTLTGPNKDTCGTGYAGRVFVYGGAGPYRVDNSLPGGVLVSKTTIDRPGDYFDVTLTGGCMTTIPVVVIDQWGRQVSLLLSSVKGAE